MRLVRRGGQSTNRVPIDNRAGQMEADWGISVYFVLYETIINWHGTDIQSWNITINCKGVVEAVINCPVVLFSQCNFLVLAFI